jgi:hypothetical protein
LPDMRQQEVSGGGCSPSHKAVKPPPLQPLQVGERQDPVAAALAA